MKSSIINFWPNPLSFPLESRHNHLTYSTPYRSPPSSYFNLPNIMRNASPTTSIGQNLWLPSNFKFSRFALLSADSADIKCEPKRVLALLNGSQLISVRYQPTVTCLRQPSQLGFHTFFIALTFGFRNEIEIGLECLRRSIRCRKESNLHSPRAHVTRSRRQSLLTEHCVACRYVIKRGSDLK